MNRQSWHIEGNWNRNCINYIFTLDCWLHVSIWLRNWANHIHNLKIRFLFFRIIVYAVTTFAKVGTSIDPYLSSIMLGIAQIAGSLSTTYFADKLGRIKLNLISLMGSACGLFSTALYRYLYLIDIDLSSFAWVPILSLSLVVFISAAGITPMSYVCSVENLPTEVRFTCSLRIWITD